MITSENINELAVALISFQEGMSPIAKRANNPHLGNSYATLDDIIEATRKPLADNGLAVTQMLDGDCLTTMLLHKSGQWIASTSVIAKMRGNKSVNDAQVLGGSLTYFKRYAMSAILNLSTDEDTDGSLTVPHAPQRWVEVPEIINSFWPFVMRKGLAPEQVLEALGVEDLGNYQGDQEQAIAAIDMYITNFEKETAGE